MIGLRKPALVYGATPTVNLLPPVERERRERTELIRRWGTVALGAAALVVVVTLALALFERSAEAGLRDAQARTRSLAARLADYADVSSAVSAKGSYESHRSQAMATDLSWSGLLGRLQSRLPAGATISAFDVVVGPEAGEPGTDGSAGAAGGAGGGADDAAAIGAVATPPQGTAVALVLEVTSRRPLDQQTMVAAFEGAPGVLGADLGSLSSEGFPDYTSTTAVFFDSSVYSGRFARSER